MDEQYPSSGGEKSNKMLWTVLAAVLIILVGGFIGYALLKDDEPEPQASATNTSQPESSTPTFEPADTASQPYAATITSTLSGAPKSATILSDGQGNYSYTYQAEGQTLSTVYTADAYYVCANQESCIKYPIDNTQANHFDPEQYQYDSTKLEELRNTAAYKGQEPCPGGKGTCDVWEVKGDQTNTTVSLYIDPETKRILKAVSSDGTTTTEITYDYKNVEVAVPTNFTTP